MHLLHIHRVDQMNPLVPAQNRECTFTHHGTQMHRVHDLHVRMAVYDF